MKCEYVPFLNQFVYLQTCYQHLTRVDICCLKKFSIYLMKRVCMCNLWYSKTQEQVDTRQNCDVTTYFKVHRVNGTVRGYFLLFSVNN